MKYCASGDMSLPNQQQSEDASQWNQQTTKQKTETEATLMRDVFPFPYPPLQKNSIELPLSLASRFSLKETLVFKLIAVITFQCTVTEVSGSTKLANVRFGTMSLWVTPRCSLKSQSAVITSAAEQEKGKLEQWEGRECTVQYLLRPENHMEVVWIIHHFKT